MTKFHRNERGDYEIAGAILVLILLLVFGGGYALAKNSHREVRTCTVVDKDRTRTENGSDMRIYTENCGVLQVSDTLFGGQFNSSDVYSQIKPQHTYKFTTAGWRVSFLSMFPNIINVEEVK